jgi:hypothetical protein
LIKKRHPTLADHINTLGPAEWNLTGDKIMSKNSMIGLTFKTMAKYIIKLEDSLEEWHLAPVRGHTRIHKLFPFYPADISTLETQRIVSVSQLFETNLSGRIDKIVSSEIMSLWRAGYTPTDRQTSWGVLHHPCTVPVYKLLFIRQ